MSITSQLKEPFDPNVIHWRVGATTAKKEKCKTWEASKGIALAYVDARDVMKRLDDVCGDDWQVEYPFEGCCRVGIKIDGEWVWRSNGAGETEVEGEKGRYSDAFKRAAVLWGVGRYLYYLPNVWCDLDKGKIKKPPPLPAWAQPGAVSQASVLERHNQAVRENMESITAIKDGIHLGNLSSAKEAWNELEGEVQEALTVAPTKGGIFTTAERATMKSNEWFAV